MRDAFERQKDDSRVLILTDFGQGVWEINDWKNGRWRREMRNGVLYEGKHQVWNQKVLTSILEIFDQMDAEIRYIPEEQNKVAAELAKITSSLAAKL